jgi:hypothetical protein
VSATHQFEVTAGTAATSTTGSVGDVITFLYTVSATADGATTQTTTLSMSAPADSAAVIGSSTNGNAASRATTAQFNVSAAATPAGSNLTSSTYSQPTLSIVAAAAGAFTSTNTISIKPDKAGIYTLTSTPANTLDSSATAGTTLAAKTFTIYVGYSAGGAVNTNRAFPTQGSNTTTGWAATAGGQATVRITGMAASSTYFVTTDTGAILSGTGSNASGRVPVAAAVTLTNGTNLGGGFNYATSAGVTSSDYMDVKVTDTGSPATTTVTVRTFDAGTGAATTFVTATVTWGVAATPSAQYSLLTLNAGTGTTATGAAADTTATIASRSLSSGAAVEKFRIQVVVKDQYDVAYTGATLAASVTGPASLGINGTANSGDVVGGTSVSEAMTSSSVGSISVFNNGTAGTAVITITATTAAGVATTLGSKTVKFAGSASKATISQNQFIAKAGTQLGLTPSTTNTTGGWSTSANTPAFQVSLTDSTGVAPMAGATVKMTSSDASVIVVGTCAELTVAGSPAATNPVAAGTFDCSVSGATGAASGKSATVSFSVLNTTTGLYEALGSTPITFTIGGAIAKCAITADKASYDPGAGVNLTATCTDSSGNKAYDGQTPYVAISSNKTFGGALPTTSAQITNGKTSTTSSTGVAGLFAPSVVGAVTISGKAAATDDAPTGTAFSVALSVNDGNAVLLTQIDALNAKIVALNALIAKIMKKLGVK